jgi:vacuolar-type H+-ATPase subunit C/Vma6
VVSNDVLASIDGAVVEVYYGKGVLDDVCLGLEEIETSVYRAYLENAASRCNYLRTLLPVVRREGDGRSSERTVSRGRELNTPVARR